MDLKRGKTGRKWHISFLAMLVLFLCAFFLRQPVYAEVGTDDETTAEGPAGTIDETAPEETEPEEPQYHEAVTIPLSSPFTYGSITEDTELVFVTGEEKPINIRGGAGTDFPAVGYTQKWQSFRLLGLETDNGGKTWYKVLIELETESYEGYLSSSVSRSVTLSAAGDAYANYLILMGFPESYATRLSRVHSQYPKWFFVPDFTGLEWSDAFYAEANPDHSVGISLVYMASALSSYMSMKHNNFDWENNTWRLYDSGGWTLASDELVAFYLDPRNFLTTSDNSIFLFLNLQYDGTQTEEGVRKIVQGTFMEDGKHKYGETFSYPAELLRIGREEGVSPYYLAATIRQEIGPVGSGSVSGSFQGNLYYFSGIYNYYNIGAFSHDGMVPVESALKWASTKPSGSNPYNRPWDERIKALAGGAKYFVYNYIGRGQNTFYYKKFNMVGESPYTHQYMTNVAGAYSEATYFGRAYDAGARDAILSFDIPIYNNMPEQACPRPTKNGNPNTRLKSLTAGDAVISPALNVNDTDYSAAVFASSVTISAETIDANARVDGTGTFELAEGENIITLTVTAQNGDVREYHMSIWYEELGDVTPETEYTVQDERISGIAPGTNAGTFKEGIRFAEGVNWILAEDDGQEKTDDALMKTGDRIQILSSNGVVCFSYTVLIYGDVNGDGMINISDLIKVRNHILGDNPLTDVFALAGNVNRDSYINISDLIKIRNHILGETPLSQAD